MTSLLNDGHSQATGLLRVTAHWCLSSESVVCVRSYVGFSTGLTRTWSLGTRSAIPHPRRSQIAPGRALPAVAAEPRRRVEPSNYFVSLPDCWMRPGCPVFHTGWRAACSVEDEMTRLH